MTATAVWPEAVQPGVIEPGAVMARAVGLAAVAVFVTRVIVGKPLDTRLVVAELREIPGSDDLRQVVPRTVDAGPG
jgi:hypothetical protein